MPTTTTIPVWTRAAAGNVKSSGSVNASATGNTDINYDGVIGGVLTVNNTPGGSVAATRGLRIDFFFRYGTTPTTSATPAASYTLPSQTASTLESRTINVPPGQWNVKWTNLDGTNAITVEITGDTFAIQTS